MSNWKIALQDRIAEGQELLGRDKADPQRCCAQVRHYTGKALPSYLRCRKRARLGRLTCWCHRQMESEGETPTTESLRDRAERLFREQDPAYYVQYTLDEILAIEEENAALDADLAARPVFVGPPTDPNEVPL
jgi:hypothetical protein